MKARTYFLIFAVSLLATLAFEASLTAQYSMGHSCPAGILVYSDTAKGFQFEGDPPLFSVQQFLLAPGSTAQITVIYTPYGGNNLTQILQSAGYFNSGPSYQYIARVGHFDSYSFGPNNGTGLTIVASPVRQVSQNEAMGNLTITAAPNAEQTTYDIGALDCPGAVLLTVGYFPYWEPFLASVQGVTIVVSVVIAGITTAMAALVSFLLSRIARGQPRPQSEPEG